MPYDLKSICLYDIQFTRLDEGSISAYLVAAPTNDEAGLQIAIEKAEQRFIEQYGAQGYTVVPINVVTNPVERRKHDLSKTYYRNRAIAAHPDVLI